MCPETGRGFRLSFHLLLCCIIHLCELLLQHVDLIHQGSLLLVVLPEAFLQGLILPLQVLKHTSTHKSKRLKN